MQFTEQQISIVARSLSDSAALACGVNKDDTWKIYSEQYIEEATSALEKLSAAAPQVVADERAAFEAYCYDKHPIGGPDRGLPEYANSGTQAAWEIWQARAALAAAPVQAQEPFAYMIADGDGKAHIDEVCCSSGKFELDAEVNGLNQYGDGRPYTVVPVYRAPVQPVAVPDGAGRGYSLGRSIIYECPALVLSQSFIQKLGGAAQIIPLRSMSDEAAKQLVNDCNSAAPAAQGDAKDAALLSQVAALANKWNADAIKDGFAGSDAAFELLEVLGWPDADIAAKAAS